MAGFRDSPAEAPAPLALALAPALIGPDGLDELADANLYAVSAQIAHRAARASTRRAYAGIYGRFCDLLRDQLGRPPTVGDLGVDAIAAYARHLEAAGGRGGGPAATATRRVHLTLLRALAGALGLEDVAAAVRLPGHRVGPPETITDTDYANLLRSPDRRAILGRRDHAILRLMGDCGVRNAELRALVGRSVRRPRANGAHHGLYVLGKGGTEREVPIPAATFAALEAWLAVHPSRSGRSGIADREPLFVRLGPGGREQAGPLSGAALHKLVRRHAAAAGIAERLAHPHVLRAYYATTLATEGVAVHVIARRLGHADIQTTSRYLVETGDDQASVGVVLDRRHQAQQRGRVR